jgi:hypothetical protein
MMADMELGRIDDCQWEQSTFLGLLNPLNFPAFNIIITKDQFYSLAVCFEFNKRI